MLLKAPVPRPHSGWQRDRDRDRDRDPQRWGTNMVTVRDHFFPGGRRGPPLGCAVDLRKSSGSLRTRTVTVTRALVASRIACIQVYVRVRVGAWAACSSESESPRESDGPSRHGAGVTVESEE
jgi:hypothetical protein